MLRREVLKRDASSCAMVYDAESELGSGTDGYGGEIECPDPVTWKDRRLAAADLLANDLDAYFSSRRKTATQLLLTLSMP